MTENQIYTKHIEHGGRPTHSLVPVDLGLADARGKIENLLFTPITSVARIFSKKGTVRANHYHRTDWHYAFVESGAVIYFERPIGDMTVPPPSVFEAGSMFFTPSMVEHAMLFAEDTVIYTFAKNVRSHEEHEADLTRVSFVTSEIVDKYIKP